ncbi:phage tail domain-containing protein [Lactococcus nasutitermitis]|uniref:Phage tail domain-containing protein n=1 Tax=Lactococcus nasutitermitis TaxID=1652957 RepID=A0ABV9JGT5_9LACT|nr:phage tail domain-containing protein [Lactococcus nasutitermitis]
MTNTSEKITYTNANGDMIIFSFSPPFVLLGKSGFAGISNDIVSEKIYGQAGELKNSSQLAVRELEIDAMIYGQTLQDENDYRRSLIKAINPLLTGTLRYELFGKTYAIDVEVVQGWESDYQQSSHTAQGSVKFKALYPLWRDISEENYTVQLGQTNNQLTFPLMITDDFIFASVDVGKEVQITNGGDIPIGFELTIDCTAEVVNPKLLNIYTQEFFAFNHTFSGGDNIFINTNRGKKQVLVNGENGFFLRKLGSTFLQIDNLENNYFILQADKGVENMVASLKYHPQLVGV